MLRTNNRIIDNEVICTVELRLRAWISSIEEFLEVEGSGFPPSFTYVYRAPAYPPRAVNWLPIGLPVSYPRLHYGRYCDSLAAATLAGATAGLFLPSSPMRTNRQQSENERTQTVFSLYLENRDMMDGWMDE
ncbi:putative myosin head [Trichinella spiralis]|uniref:putative myosin head n=1 Tax=Trichinella spiralis TaxID=6334 RepID=UPI0001EFEC5A|nr:putative myosin head [Trichinella spiralis]